MNIPWFMGIALVTVVGGLILKKYNPTYAVVLAIVGGGLVFMRLSHYLNELVVYVTELADRSGIHSQWLKQLLKAMGICYIAKFGVNLCTDAGETAMAGYLELAGKVMIVWLSMPLLSQIADIIIRLIEL